MYPRGLLKQLFPLVSTYPVCVTDKLAFLRNGYYKYLPGAKKRPWLEVRVRANFPKSRRIFMNACSNFEGLFNFGEFVPTCYRQGIECGTPMNTRVEK